MRYEHMFAPRPDGCPLRRLQALRERLDIEVLAGLVLRVEVAQRLEHEPPDGPGPVPLAVGRDDVPRRVRRAAQPQRVLVGGPEVAPVVAVAQVVGLELPALVRPLQAPQLALALVVAADVQEDL